MAGNYDLSKLKSHGDDVRLSEFVDIRYPELFECGNRIAIDAWCSISCGIKIGDYLHIGPNTSIIGGKTAHLEIGDFTSIAAGVRIIVLGDEHKGHGIVGALIPAEQRDKLIGGKMSIGDFAAIGTNAVIFPGINIGAGAVIAAGSVLKVSARPWTIYAGNPAAEVGMREQEAIRHHGYDLWAKKFYDKSKK